MIRRRVFEQSGESFESQGGTCQGDECPFYYQAAGETIEERHTEAKRQCGKNCSPPDEGKNETDIDNAAVEKLVNEINDIVFWQDAESKTDWKHYPFEYRMLYGIWREAEKQVNRIQQGRLQMFIKGFAGGTN